MKSPIAISPDRTPQVCADCQTTIDWASLIVLGLATICQLVIVWRTIAWPWGTGLLGTNQLALLLTQTASSKPPRMVAHLTGRGGWGIARPRCGV